MKAEADPGDRVSGADTGRNSGTAAARVEAELANRTRTKAEVVASSLMEAVVERGNLKLAYQRVVKNKGAAGVDALTVAEFKSHLQQHWPTIKGRLLAGTYQPQPVRRVDIPKPQGGVRTLGIPTLVDRLIQQALHQVLQPIFERPHARARNLMQQGLTQERAWRSTCNQRSPWWNAGASHMHAALPKSWFDHLGLVSLLDTVQHFQRVS